MCMSGVCQGIRVRAVKDRENVCRCVVQYSVNLYLLFREERICGCLSCTEDCLYVCPLADTVFAIRRARSSSNASSVASSAAYVCAWVIGIIDCNIAVSVCVCKYISIPIRLFYTPVMRPGKISSSIASAASQPVSDANGPQLSVFSAGTPRAFGVVESQPTSKDMTGQYVCTHASP